MGERTLYITPRDFAVMVVNGSDVAMSFDLDPQTTGFAPGLGLALRMSPSEARRLADVLLRKAREAEGGSSQLT